MFTNAPPTGATRQDQVCLFVIVKKKKICKGCGLLILCSALLLLSFCCHEVLTFSLTSTLYSPQWFWRFTVYLCKEDTY